MSVYPPLAVRLMGLITWATGAHWYWTVVAMRVLAVIGLGLLAWSMRTPGTRVKSCGVVYG